ncbi:MAG: hypothetical protein Q8N23_22030 [Archangium sp.]|nr:hypothetical protein [Archangium sp.]MDP3573705.1 hypothetical protein [Archangium sp.]
MGTVAAVVFAMTLTVTPTNGGLLSPPQVTINDQQGEQFDPHVDADTAAYSNAVDMGAAGLLQQIRYYDFPTNQDVAISNLLAGGGLANDLLSDVDQGRIVFTRLFPDRSAIMLFDITTQTLTELAPAPSTTRMGVALGSQTVAFVDYASGPGELMVLDLATSVVTRLTNDAVSDTNPAVSPDGNVITWERCASSANCDVYRANRSGGLWLIAPLASQVLNELSADTNGSLVVFQRENMAGPTGTNIVLVPVTGGPETVLEIPGEQYNPSIRGQLVAFESREPFGNPDIFLVELTSNRIFQITNTPDLAESLNDVTVLPNGEVRLVWQSVALTDPNNANIYAATFTLPAAPVVDAGTPDAGTPDAGTACLNRSVTIEATRFYSPTRSVDGQANFTPSMSFAIPAAIPVVAGNAGNKKADLTINLGNRTVECEYRSRSNQSHPTSPTQLALASSYVLDRCRVHNGGCRHGGSGNTTYTAGTVVNAISAELHIQNGDTHQPLTRVRLTLGEVCSSTVSSPLEASNDIDGAQAAGCSSSGASLTPFLIAFAFLALLLRRQASIRLVTQREQRRLPR